MQKMDDAIEENLLRDDEVLFIPDEKKVNDILDKSIEVIEQGGLKIINTYFDKNNLFAEKSDAEYVKIDTYKDNILISSKFERYIKHVK